MSNIIDSIRLSGTVYTIAGGSGGNPTVELTQAEYDDLVSAGTVSPTTYYIITDAQPTDISLYWTSAQTKSAITQAVSGKQDTLSAGTNITIVDNVISATGGGGSTYSAGRGIDITNETISFSLPIYSGSNYGITIGYNTGVIAPIASGQGAVAHGSGTYATGGFSHAEGSGTYAIGVNSHAEGSGTYAYARKSHAEGSSTSTYGEFSHAEGYRTVTYGECSHAEGIEVIARNLCEHSQGRYNVSNSATTTFGDSGNTLFSVGNGTGDNARHNAFEIRQNGDIYITSGGTDILLQDNLGGLKLVKITAADYANITPDENTVYFVGDSNGYTMKLGSVNIS